MPQAKYDHTADSPGLSRRALLAISAAALAGTASAAPLTQTETAPSLPTLLNPGSDAELIAMVRDWMETWTRFTRLCQEDERNENETNPDISAAMKRLHELEERIARTRATTREGLLAKAQMPVLDSMALNGTGIEGEFEDALAGRESTGHFMGLSLILDILEMNGGQA